MSLRQKPHLSMIEWNQRATALLGWNACPGSAMGANHDVNLLGLIVGETDAETMLSSVRRVLNGEKDCTATVRTLVACGEVRNCRWSLTPLTRADGRVWAFISMVIDMSEEERVALEFKALRSQLARAEETERARIARELHDDLSQRMATVAIELQMHQDLVAALGNGELATSFTGLRDMVETVSTDIHSISRQLHPTVLDDLGLLSALRSECSRRSKTSGVDITCEGNLLNGEPRGATGLALFRVVQESLRNALAHGRPTRISVAINQDGEHVDMTVEDDGGGFSATHARSSERGVRKGIGFASMRERMILVGGDLRVNTMLGIGTVVRAVVPLHPENRDAPERVDRAPEVEARVPRIESAENPDSARIS